VIAWGDFYVLVSLFDLEPLAKDIQEDAGFGQYPDALWFHRGRHGLEQTLAKVRDTHPPAKVVQVFPMWGWTRCRITVGQDGKASVSVPGIVEPFQVDDRTVFRGEDFRRELERRSGKPPVLAQEIPDGHTLLTLDESPEYQEQERTWSLRRDIASMEMVLGVIDGDPPVETLAVPRIRRLMRERERREVDHVKPMPTVLADMIRMARKPGKASAATKRLTHADVQAEVLPSSQLRLTARLSPDCRAMLHGKPKPAKVPRLTGRVSMPPLPWEERTFDIAAKDESGARAIQLAQGMLEMCAHIDLDFHRSAAAVAAEIMRTGRFVVTLRSLHRLRGGEEPPGQKERARYLRHLAIMRTLSVEIDLPDGSGILSIPFASGGAKVLHPETREVMASTFHAVPDSIVGMMMAEGGFRWQYWLDTRAIRLEDDLAYSLHHVLARQWAARMTRNAVEDEATRHAWNLATVLDRTSLRDVWRTRRAKQGTPWLRKRVQAALDALNAIGLYGAAGSARVEWNAEDVTVSRVVFGEPPRHFLEAHLDTNSKRIAGAKKKRLRLEQREGGERVGRGKGEGRKGKKRG
jgi:hypothetical protein